LNLAEIEFLPWIFAFTLLVLGFCLILLEIFVIPGFNIFGIFGFLTMCAGVGYAYVKLGLGPAVAVAALALVGTVFLVRLLIRARAWQRMVLESETSRELGYDSSRPDLSALVGQSGETLTSLRPSGRAQFGDRIVDVVTEGDFVSTGDPVEVLTVEGNRVVVQKIGAADTQ
jgi:membrane-bound serine protease (ClpP class)